MSENYTTFPTPDNYNSFKEAVCIDAYRVYDSCADKDCLENLRVFFTEPAQHIIDQSNNIRIRNVNVEKVCLNLEPVAFQRGFYSIDITFFFEINIDACLSPSAPSVNVSGISVFNKKVVLYGSEGNVKIYSSDLSTQNNCDYPADNLKNIPKATIQVADPIGLSINFVDKNNSNCREIICRIPDSICRKHSGDFIYQPTAKMVNVSIGLFSIVQIERNVQMLIPAYDFCIPQKECVTSTDNPCDLFSKIEFPTDQFFPPKVLSTSENNDIYSCSCNKTKEF